MLSQNAAKVVPSKHSKEEKDGGGAEATKSAAAQNEMEEEEEDEDEWELGSDSDDGDGGGPALVLSKQHEEKKRKKQERLRKLQELQKPMTNFSKARQALKEKVMKDVLDSILPEMEDYDVTAPPPDTGKRWWDPLIRFGKFIGIVNLTLHEAVLSGSEVHLERSLEEVHQGKKSNRPLLSMYDIRGCTPLSMACKTNQIAMVQLIVARHAEVDVPDINTGRSPMFFAARHGSHMAVKFLLNGGANPGFADFHGITPLMMAASKDDYRSVMMMLDPRQVKGGHFVEIDQQDNNGWTALHFAVQGKAPRACKVLVSEGADRNLKDKTSRSPLHLAQFLDDKYRAKHGQHCPPSEAWGDVIVQLEDTKAILTGQKVKI